MRNDIKATCRKCSGAVGPREGVIILWEVYHEACKPTGKGLVEPTTDDPCFHCGEVGDCGCECKTCGERMPHALDDPCPGREPWEGTPEEGDDE
jgi:hypothetical protein